ncbi:hypothetical protein ATK30_8417 [Amycolatopsis echigonensis]|uniref:Uncharacterized protein n=1 Tax=Amycolatopsis echigonensis TaxID=2576905 RepID=A0A2N3WU83_9PSEU|nr:hypothetical protein ATK30_8417 [Amycolatopsis niigatensis]
MSATGVDLPRRACRRNGVAQPADEPEPVALIGRRAALRPLGAADCGDGRALP